MPASRYHAAVILELVLGFLSSLQGLQAYGWVFLLLALGGMGAPVSQDMLLLAAAGMTLLGAMQPGPLLAVAALGLLAGDVFTFWVGRHWGARWVRRPWAASFVAPERLPALEDKARRHALPSSFVTRFLPGQRSTLFFVAGTLRMPWRAFLVGDGVAAIVQACAFTYGVRELGWRWSHLRAPFDRVDDVLTAGLVVLVLVALWRKPRRA